MEKAELDVMSFPAIHRQMRIAVVTETYPPDVNGVALTLRRVVEGLQGLGHDVFLVRPRQSNDATAGDPAHELLVQGMPIPMYPALKIGFPAKRALVKLWTSRRPDLVHIATEGPLGWSAIQAAKKLRIPMTSDFRTNFHAYSAFYGFRWMKSTILSYMKKFHNATQCTMVPTAELKQTLAGLGFHRLMVIPRGIDTQLFDPVRRSEALRSSWGVTAATCVLLSVGRLAAEKNLNLVLKVFHQARMQNRDIRLVFVGDGPLKEKLVAQCPEAIFCGVQHGEALAAHYASGDIFLFPSLTETFGNVTLEALASGIAVVAFDCAGARQLISSDVSGILLPTQDESSFVERSIRLAQDANQRNRLGMAARQVSLENQWATVVKRTEAVMLQVLADRTG